MSGRLSKNNKFLLNFMEIHGHTVSSLVNEGALPVKSEINERRQESRCAKDVGMHCALLHGDESWSVIVRNYSVRGLYFESQAKIQPGTIIVLRTMTATDALDNDATSTTPLFSIDKDDPVACTLLRSHILAKVRRCDRLDGNNGVTRYGLGAELPVLTD